MTKRAPKPRVIIITIEQNHLVDMQLTYTSKLCFNQNKLKNWFGIQIDKS